jgi:hypothetical protein
LHLCGKYKISRSDKIITVQNKIACVLSLIPSGVSVLQIPLVLTNTKTK